MMEAPPPAFIDLEPVFPKQHKIRARRLRHTRHSSQLAAPDYLTDPVMTDVGIPDFLQHSYLKGIPMPKITELREWQHDLFTKEEWKRGDNSIVLVPTSGGKTVAADVAIAQALAKDREAKAIYALPFVSLASEKTTEYRHRFNEFAVRPFYQNIGGPDFRRGSIAICTYEKVHSLLNSAIKDDYVDKLAVVVIDEIHMIGEAQRGSVIEAMIVKLMLLRPYTEIRIIGLTATLNREDATRLSNWIKGFTFFCASRPSRIRHFFKQADGSMYRLDAPERPKIMTVSSTSEDKRQLLPVVRMGMRNSPSSIVIVFVNTRKETVHVAKIIAEGLKEQDESLAHPQERIRSARDLLIQRLSKTETGLDPYLGFCVKNGVAFHHAGMLLEERKLIEDAARDSTISVIVATTTLSAGINIRSVSGVVIYDIYRKTRTSRNELIPTSVYTQMAGRAGRDERRGGDVFILGRSNDVKELNDAAKLAQQQLDDIKPRLMEENAADRYFLQCLVSGLCSPEDGLDNFVQATLECFLSQDQEEVCRYTEEIAQRLRNLHLIEKDSVAPTPLGKAIASSALSIEEGLELKDAIDNLQTNLCLKDDVHLLYLCVPPSAISSETTPPYDSRVWQVLLDEHQEVMKLITSLDRQMFERHHVITMRNGGKKQNTDDMAKHDRELDRFFFACLLQKLIAESSVNEITDLFSVTRGSVQSLQMQAATFANQSVRFCETTGSRTLGQALNTFKERLNFGVKNELLPLMKLPSCDRHTARLLITNRISNPVELADLPEDLIAKILAQRRGDDRPFRKEDELARQLKKEALVVAKSLIIIDELESHAIANTLADAFARSRR